MAESRYTHVTIVADDLDESVGFYESAFGLERVPTPAFHQTIQWLACGDVQLHVVETDADPPAFNHHAIHAADFESAYRAIRAHDAAEAVDPFDFGPGFVDGEPPVYVLPSGAVQLYIRDPGGNLVEVNAPDADGLDPSVVTNLVERTDLDWPGPDEAPASLYMD